ncbi:carbohydrate kinase family protein [Mucilaginibacter paludis]|uniref:PfkB domain protein n=1 Tax=Mucilaginibacter paludis DSM 18603 TaxID=714943 RepID=H1Y270_9SPHI|nr:carbohydrate kinase [Mucilaginibacter paludis]EHQ26727.1 PfkB domain protein [Mucilaginibacter paludis DSM 18603]
MMNQPKIVCYGEVLWDIFPDGEKAGGAPFNVTYNLKKQGIDSRIISAVGYDELGDRLLAQIKDWNIPLDECQRYHNIPTGTVMATIDEKNEAHYQIVEDVAWDNIAWTPENDALVRSSDAFVYGSLSARNETSRNTLCRLIEAAPFKVFDINLRPPFYNPELLSYLISKANLVKLNKAELREILDIYNKPYISEEESLRFLKEKFNTDEILLTKGSRGAIHYSKGIATPCDAITVTVNDTVGSGDSFLAGYLAARASNASVAEALYNAAAMGAFITTRSGACPPYQLEDFEKFKQQNLPQAPFDKTA